MRIQGVSQIGPSTFCFLIVHGTVWYPQELRSKLFQCENIFPSPKEGLEHAAHFGI